MTEKYDNRVGHLNIILARGGGNLNDPIFKCLNARALSEGGVGGDVEVSGWSAHNIRVVTRYIFRNWSHNFTQNFDPWSQQWWEFLIPDPWFHEKYRWSRSHALWFQIPTIVIPDPVPFQAFDLVTTLQYYNGWVFTVFCGPFTWLTPLRDSFAILPHEYAWGCRSMCYSSPVRYKLTVPFMIPMFDSGYERPTASSAKNMPRAKDNLKGEPIRDN